MTNLTELAREIHAENYTKGFWDRERPLTETTMLIVSELVEAVEEERAGRPALWYYDSFPDAEGAVEDFDYLVFDEDGAPYMFLEDGLEGIDVDYDHPLKPEGADIELVDALIRLLDLLGARGVGVDELLKQKLAYNRTRPEKHGKKF